MGQIDRGAYWKIHVNMKDDHWQLEMKQKEPDKTEGNLSSV
jgi:hypothetical protein